MWELSIRTLDLAARLWWWAAYISGSPSLINRTVSVDVKHHVHSPHGISPREISLHGISLQKISPRGISPREISLHEISVRGILLHGISPRGSNPLNFVTLWLVTSRTSYVPVNCAAILCNLIIIIKRDLLFGYASNSHWAGPIIILKR